MRWDQELRGEWFPDAVHASREDAETILSTRRITDEVRDRRPYTYYDAGDWDRVIEAEPRYLDMNPGRVRWLRGAIDQRPGIVMHRATWGGRRLLAQLRPFKYKELGLGHRVPDGVEDDGVWTRPNRHDHDEPEPHRHDERSTKQRRRNPWAEPCPDRSVFGFDCVRARGHVGLHRGPWLDEHLLNQHRGRAFPIDVEHDHARDMSAHVRAEHAGEGVDGLHAHEHRAKYLYPPGEDPSLVDVHPLAWPLLDQGGPVVYFALEGILKADAILSLGEPVVSVGSVTLWGDSALGWLAENYLSRFGTTAIAPDSDAFGNSAVMSQARQLQTTLERFGIRSVVAIPTAKCSPVCDHYTRDIGHPDGIRLPNEDHKQGVDDMLGVNGQNAEGGLLGMIVQEHDEPVSVTIEARHDIRARERDEAVLQYLQTSAADDGHVWLTRQSVALALGYSDHHVIERALEALAGDGLLEIENALDFGYQPARRRVRRSRPRHRGQGHPASRRPSLRSNRTSP